MINLCQGLDTIFDDNFAEGNNLLNDYFLMDVLFLIDKILILFKIDV
jgi:hypothetical protein